MARYTCYDRYCERNKYFEHFNTPPFCYQYGAVTFIVYNIYLYNQRIKIWYHLQTLDNHVIYKKGNQYVTRFHANKKGGVLPSFFCAIYHI